MPRRAKSQLEELDKFWRLLAVMPQGAKRSVNRQLMESPTVYESPVNMACAIAKTSDELREHGIRELVVKSMGVTPVDETGPDYSQYVLHFRLAPGISFDPRNRGRSFAERRSRAYVDEVIRRYHDYTQSFNIYRIDSERDYTALDIQRMFAESLRRV